VLSAPSTKPSGESYGHCEGPHCCNVKWQIRDVAWLMVFNDCWGKSSGAVRLALKLVAERPLERFDDLGGLVRRPHNDALCMLGYVPRKQDLRYQRLPDCLLGEVAKILPV